MLNLRCRFRLPLFVASCCLGLATVPAFAQDAIQPVDPGLDRPVDFYQDVAPILQAKCLACHSAAVKEGDLILETAASLIAGGASGEAVVPGDVSDSLIYLVASREYEPAMPPLPNSVQAQPLSPHELGILKAWIEQGAKAGTRPAQSSIDWRPIPEEYRAVYSLALTPDEHFIAAGRGNRIFIYDLVQQKEVARLTDPHLQAIPAPDGGSLYGPGVAQRDFVHSLAVSPDGRTFASGGYRAIKLWNRQEPVPLAELQLPAPVLKVATSPQGDRAAFVLENQVIQLWNLTTGEAAPAIPTGETQCVDIAFSADGSELITGDAAGQLKVFSAADGTLLISAMTPNPVVTLRVRPDSSQVIAAHADNSIRLYEWPQPAEDEAAPESPATVTLEPIREITGHSQPAKLLQLCSQSQELVTSGDDRTVRIWNLESGENVFYKEAEALVTAIAASADAQQIAVALESGDVQLWNHQGENLGKFRGEIDLLRQARRRADDLEVANSRTGLASAAREQAEKDLNERNETLKKAQEDLEKSKTALTDAEGKVPPAEEALTQAKAKLDETPEDEGAKNAHAEAEKAVNAAKEAVKTAQDAVTSNERGVELSQNSATAAEAALNARKTEEEQELARKQEIEGQRTAAQTAADQQVPQVTSMAMLFDDALLLTAGPQPPIQSWRTRDGHPVETLTLTNGPLSRVTSTANGAVLVVGSDGTATLWDVTPRWTLAATLGPNAESPLAVDASVLADRVTALAFSPDGTLLASGGGEPSRNGELIVWNVAERSIQRKLEEAHSDVVSDIEFSRDGAFLLSGAADKFVKVFRVDDGHLVRAYEGHTDHVLGVAFKADGSSLASAGADKAIKVWNTETGEQRKSIEDYSKQVMTVDYLGVSDNILSSSGDHSVKLHRANSGQNYQTLSGNQDYVYAAAGSPNGELIIAAGEDGVVRAWNAEDGRLLDEFAPPPAPETAQHTP